MRNEVLANEDLDTVLEVRIIVKQWAFEKYNTRRPHRAHGMLTPRQFAEGWKAGRRREILPTQEVDQSESGLRVGPVKGRAGADWSRLFVTLTEVVEKLGSQ